MEARYPVSQPKVSGLGPSRVVFRLPSTLPVQRPIQGVVRDPYVAGPPAVKLTNAEITNQGIIRSIQQLIAIGNLSKILRVDVAAVAPSPPIFSIRGITQFVPLVMPSDVITVPIADIVSQVVLRGLTQFPFVVDSSKLIRIPFAELTSSIVYKIVQPDVPITLPSEIIAIIAPTIIPSLPPIFALRNILKDLNIPLQPSSIELPLAELTSNATIRGLLQDLITVGLPSIRNPIAEITSNVVLKGLIQDIARVGNPTILATIAEIVKQGFIKGLPQDLILVGPSELVLPAPVEIVSSAVLQGIIQGRLLVEPSKIVKPAAQTGIVFLTGIIRNCPSLAPLGGVTVLAFRTSDNIMIGSTVSDGAGNYSIQVVPGVAHYLVAYLPNTPDVFGTTRNDLFGT